MALDAGLDFERPLNELEKKIEELRVTQERNNVDLSSELAALEKRTDELKREITSKLTPWQRVMIARHPKRPYTLDYIGMIFADFMELHGDRAFGDDAALVAGMAHLDLTPVLVIGQQKGHDLKENIARNFGMMHPEGYRKALRYMKLAEKFKKPVITFIDTPGAYPGIGAEERGQAEAIARNLAEMSFLKTPIVAIVIGEGGSGGALGIGVADRVLMLEHSVYSVITPEGCAAILWKSAKNAPEAAAALKMTSRDLLELGVIDEIVPEPPGGAHRDQTATAAQVKTSLKNTLAPLLKLPVSMLIEKRLAKFRRMGQFTEAAQ